MDAEVQIRYAGVVIAKAVEQKGPDGGTAFLALDAPLPVGTPLEVEVGGSLRPARVARVVETPDLGAVGMEVKYLDVVSAPVISLVVPPPQRATAATQTARPSAAQRQNALLLAALGLRRKTKSSAPAPTADGAPAEAAPAPAEQSAAPEAVASSEPSSEARSTSPVPDEPEGKKKKKKKR